VAILQFLQVTPSGVQELPLSSGKGWQVLAVLITSLGVAVALLNLIFSHVLPRLRTRRDKRSVTKSLIAPSLRDDEIEAHCRYYVEPSVQDVDPMGAEEPRGLAGVKSTFFSTLDEFLDPTSEHPHIILLADSGMGKTSALVNYCARQVRKRGRKFNVALILLSRKHVLKHIEMVSDKKQTILFLDAFDEDMRAVQNHRTRLDELMDAADDFFRVVISCRAQFFSTDEEIPRETGTVMVGRRRFEKLYLSPFSQRQTAEYLSKRYPLHLWKPLNLWRYRRAKQIADNIPHLSARPLLLTFIDLLLNNQPVSYAFEIYEKMVVWWVAREQNLVGTESQLERFSELLAVNIYQKRQQREEGERIARSELTSLALEWGIPVKDKQLSEYAFSTRSLLNRDAVGNYKFAHRSMMEYFYVRHYWYAKSAEAENMRSVDWTHQMLTFYWEMLERQILVHRTLPFDRRSKNDDFLLEADQVPFLIALTLHGLSLLRSPKIAHRRLKPILETATALSARLIDPEGEDDPVVSLIALKQDLDGRYAQHPIAIHHHGMLLEKEKADLSRNRRIVDDARQLGVIPDIHDEAYIRILPTLERIDAQWHSFTMPVKYRGRILVMLVGETSRPQPFKAKRHVQLIEILQLIGKYLREYAV
jgi:hypothetical protein